MEWSDKLGSRDRNPWLLLVRGEKVEVFRGVDIPGVVVVKGHDYTKDGKWSRNTYRLEIDPAVRPIAGYDGWETGRFVEGLGRATGAGRSLDNWGEVASALGISVPAAMAFLRSWRPKAAEALDEIDERLTALDEMADRANAREDSETVVVSFGSPTRRQRDEGFWTNPKAIPNHVGELRLIDKEKGWNTGNIVVSGIMGTVVSAIHSSGYGGGYVSVTVVVVPGTTAVETESPDGRLPEELPATPLTIATFKEEGKRWFRCQACGTGTVRLLSVDFDSYNRGESIACTCPTCNAQGSAQK